VSDASSASLFEQESRLVYVDLPGVFEWTTRRVYNHVDPSHRISYPFSET
jgi:hypothetical protein